MLEAYLAARDAAQALNAKLKQAEKDIEAAKRRHSRLATEATAAEQKAIELKKQLDAATAQPTEKTGKTK